MINKYVVYALIDPITGGIRYIGKTQSGTNKRLSQHLANANKGLKSHVYCWIRSLTKLGLTPLIEVLESYDSSKRLYESEQALIAIHKESGVLTNLTDGGPGRTGSSCSDETKQKLRVSVAKFHRENPEKSQFQVNAMMAYHAANPEAQSGRLKKFFEEHPQAAIERSVANGGRAIVDQYGNVYPTLAGAARKLGLQNANIRKVLKGLAPATGGYSFCYQESF